MGELNGSKNKYIDTGIIFRFVYISRLGSAGNPTSEISVKKYVSFFYGL